MEDPNAAEKDLLRLIENPGQVQPKAEAGAFKPASPRGLKFPFPFFRSRGLKAVPGPKPANWREALFGGKQILHVLLAATLAVFLFFVMTILRESSRLEKSHDLEKMAVPTVALDTVVPPAGDEAASPEGEAVISVESGVASSEDKFGMRNIFKPAAQRKRLESAPEDAQSVAENYRLVGISMEADPKKSYAMLENTKSNITFFIRMGETVEGMEVLGISEDKVMLNAKGKEIELR